MRAERVKPPETTCPPLVPPVPIPETSEVPSRCQRTSCAAAPRRPPDGALAFLTPRQSANQVGALAFLNARKDHTPPANFLPSLPAPAYKHPMHDEDEDPDHIVLSDDDLDALEEEIPLLRGVRAFAEEAALMPWFANLGRPLDKEVKALSRAYLDGLGFPDAEVARITEWEDALDAASGFDFDNPQWEAEEGLRAALANEALERLSEHGLTIALTHVSAVLGERIGSAVREAASFAEIDDDELLNSAAGAAIQAAHNAVLALIAEEDADHPFHRKFALFTHGRWPIGLAGLSFNLF